MLDFQQLENAVRCVAAKHRDVFPAEMAKIITSLVKNFLEINSLPVLINKNDFELIRGQSIQHLQNMSHPVWHESVYRAELTQEERRIAATILGTVDFLTGKGYIGRAIKINYEER